MPQQEFDLLEIPAVLPAELSAGPPKVMSSKVLDPNLLL